MTATPPLGRRVALSGVAVVAVVLVVVNAAVYLAFSASLHDSLRAVLDERAATARAEASVVRIAGRGPDDLARRLQARGVRAGGRAPAGGADAAAPASPLLGGIPIVGADALVSRQVSLPAGLTVQVFARSATGSLRRLLLFQTLASVLALALAGLLLARATRLTLKPLDDIVAAAGLTASGERGARLRPDRPHTELGRMAAAYDEVLDALEAGHEVAKKLERRRETVEARWRQVLEATAEAYVSIDADRRVADWNPSAENLFGWEREQILGRPVAVLVSEQHLEPFTRLLDRLLASGPGPVAQPYSALGRTRDGRSVLLEATIWGVDRRGGALVHAFVRDIGERRRVENEAARLAAVVQGSADAIVTTAPDGTILSWNLAAEQMYGWTADEAIGRHQALVVPTDELPGVGRMLADIASELPVPESQGVRMSRGGASIPVSLRMSPVHDRRGRVVAASTIARDVTEQRWMAETLDRTLTALERALEEARASEESTRRFLGDAAHQLRTPMAGIRACAETLLRGADPADADRLLATMVRETSRAARLITALLRMARLEQGDLGAPVVPVDVVPLCAAEVERLSLLSPDLDVQLVVEQAPAHPVHLDAAACQEILSNLGDNARRHAVSRIALIVDADDGRVRLRVIDDGPGVPEERREEVFERFVSLDGRGGSGLGLPIARGLARAMDGELRYENGFLLELPAQVTVEAPSAGAA